MNPPDHDIRDRLKDIDVDEEVTVTSWEADFIESVCYRDTHRVLTDDQIKKALEIIHAYEE